jgi:hypothetical protein
VGRRADTGDTTVVVVVVVMVGTEWSHGWSHSQLGILYILLLWSISYTPIVEAEMDVIGRGVVDIC